MYHEAEVEITCYELDEVNVDNASITVSPGGFFKTILSRFVNAKAKG